MAIINLLLNIAGLLLWLNWLSLRFDPLAERRAATLVGTLRKADPSGPKRWLAFSAVIALIVIRAIAYYEMGPALNWTPRLPIATMELPFRSDYLSYVLLFSFLSFICTLGAFYFSLLLLSAANQNLPETDPIQKLVRLYVRWFEPWPAWIKLLLPLIAGALFWLAVQPLLASVNILAPARPFARLGAQSIVVGVTAYLSWEYLIIGVLALHILNSYVYLGENPLWSFVNSSARNLLRPLRWLPLRIGKIDLLPLAAIFILIAILDSLPIADYFAQPPKSFRPWLYQHLPF